jgi:hypothetical protein
LHGITFFVDDPIYDLVCPAVCDYARPPIPLHFVQPVVRLNRDRHGLIRGHAPARELGCDLYGGTDDELRLGHLRHSVLTLPPA